jgi:hypothetical protein
MPEVFMSITIIIHDLVVVSTIYFVYEMLKVQVVIQSNNIKDYKLKSKILRVCGFLIAMSLAITSFVGAFFYSYGKDLIGNPDNRENGKILLIFSSAI